MTRPPLRNDSAVTLDVLDLSDDARRVSPNQPRAAENDLPIERPGIRRCDEADRELLRHHFPRS